MNDKKCRMEKNCFLLICIKYTNYNFAIENWKFLVNKIRSRNVTKTFNVKSLTKYCWFDVWISLIWTSLFKKNQGFPLNHILCNALSTLMHTWIRQQHPFTELLSRWICSCINEPINRPIQFLLTYKKSNVIPFSFWVVNLHGKNCYSDVGLVGICLHKCYFFVQYTTSLDFFSSFTDEIAIVFRFFVNYFFQLLTC